jgi:hypothetical protein
MRKHISGAHRGLKNWEPLPVSRNPNHMCPHCDRWEHSIGSLQFHIASKHSDLNEARLATPHVCEFCQKRFKTEEEMDTHRAASHQGPHPFTCGDCGKIFSNSTTLRVHVRNVHPSGDRAMCTLCSDRSFKSQSHLKTHEYQYHPELRGVTFKCAFCDEVCKNYYTLNIHRRTFHRDKINVKDNVCKICNITFKFAQYLAAHRKRHHEERQIYECKICGKKFKTLSGITDHEQRHSGVKHICHICGKKMSGRNQLIVHLRTIHRDEYEYTPPAWRTKKLQTSSTPETVSSSSTPADSSGSGYHQEDPHVLSLGDSPSTSNETSTPNES